MLLKRIHNDSGVVTHVLVKHTGSGDAQNFSERLVGAGVEAGWIVVEGETLTIKAQPEPLRYSIRRRPGYYVAGTCDRIPLTDAAWSQALSRTEATLAPREAKAYLSQRGLPVTGYEVTRAYECVLDAEQHDKFKAIVNAKGLVVGKHTQEI